MSKYLPTFDRAITWAEDTLINEGSVVDAGKWQGIQTEGHPSLMTKEVLNLAFEVPLFRGASRPKDLLEFLNAEIKPNREWADEHFAERVGGRPWNPDPSHERWPWWRGQDSTTKDEQGKFTHTYSERFWPKHTKADWGSTDTQIWPVMEGIRFKYGDLDDVIEQLWDEPMNRQAYLPIFFPEDTGAVHGGRVPCTLGYHFLLRNDQLHMWYDIRSCDAVRHFRDDIYLAVRLQLWMLDSLRAIENRRVDEPHQRWSYVKPGNLYFCAHSFHVHMGDIHLLLKDRS